MKRLTRSPPARTVDAFVRALVAGGKASSAVALVGDRRGPRTGAAARCRLADRFDLASLTKPFVATLAITLDRAGSLPLRASIGDYWPGARLPLAHRRLEDLLRHRSGLPAWAPLRLLVRSNSGAEIGDLLVRRLPLSRELKTVYSDMGYLLWGLTAEMATGEPLEVVLKRHVLLPLRLASIEAWPGPRRRGVSPSGLDTQRETELAAGPPWRRRLAPLGAPPRGVPQDGNARFLGRLAGHAGLFGAAVDVFQLASEWLAPGSLLQRSEIDRALSGHGQYALGWARRRVRGSAGPALGPRSFGHTGFTGTSLWIDPDGRPGRQIRVLLAHRTRPDSDLNRLRRAFHALG